MIRTGDFVSVGDPNQIYRVTKRIGEAVSLHLVNGRGADNIDDVDVSECKFQYSDPRVKAVQHV